MVPVNSGTTVDKMEVTFYAKAYLLSRLPEAVRRCWRGS